MTRVMICDDEPYSVEQLALCLRESDLEVEITTHPEACLAQARVKPFDLFILDMNLGLNLPPHLEDGLALAAELRKLTSAVNVPIVGITAVYPEWEERALAQGLVNFLLKPLELDEVEPQLKQILESRQKARESMASWLVQTAGEQWNLVELRLGETQAKLKSTLVNGSGQLLPERGGYRLALKLLGMGFMDQDLFEGLGAELLQRLFPPAISVGFHQHRLLSQLAERPFRLLLSFDDPAWEIVPWELSCYPGGTDSGYWLGGDARLSCVRTASNSASLANDETLSGPWRILVVGATPAGMQALDLKRELHELRQAFEPLGNRVQWKVLGHPQLDPEDEASPGKLREKIKSFKPHIVHFMCHGGKGSLFLEDAQNIAAWSDYFLKLDVSGMGIKLLVMNCCFSGHPGSASSGMAMAGGKAGVQAVIGHFFPVADGAAVDFTRLFYRGLARGEVLDQAFQEARSLVATSELEHQRSFLPVLVVRDRFFKLKV